MAIQPPLTDYSESIGHRVIILGGGFGGLYAARALGRAPVEVTLIDRRNFHLFQPLLYQVATGSLSPGEISAPLRGILSRNKNTRVLLGEAVDIDAAARQVVLADGARFEYDWLIVATGSRTSYYGHDDWSEWAPSLKTIEEATAIRHKILYAFEAAERAGDPAERSAWLTFVVIGAGATGVELSGALGEIARETLRGDFRSIDPRDARILLLDAGPRVLAAYPEPLSKKAEASLVALGVRARTKVNVIGVDESGVTFRGEDGVQHRLESRTVLWAGGVTATAFAKTIAARTGAPVDRLGRIRVEPDLTVPDHRRIRIVGDLAAVSDVKGKPLPGIAPVAMQQGAYAAKAIRAVVEGRAAPPPFRYFDKGELAVIGRGHAVANIFGMHMSGLAAWLVWLFVHLMYLVQFQSRILVFIQWGLQYLTFARGARLITGTAAKTGGTGERRDSSA